MQIGQKAQLSQRDRATLRVIEYFAKLLKVDLELFYGKLADEAESGFK